MYIPAHFNETDDAEVRRLIEFNPLGALVTCCNGVLDANHVPFLIEPAADGRWTLQAHVARNNPVWHENASAAPVMVIFRATDSYVSPNWYPSKHESHRQVPTWNYEVVHVHGAMRIHDDVRFLRGLLARLTRTHESRIGEPRPWKMGEAPADYLDARLTEIVGIEVVVSRIEAKRKLSQNKSLADQRNAADNLDRVGAPALARSMRALKS
jgi:transcriptional regulator